MATAVPSAKNLQRRRSSGTNRSVAKDNVRVGNGLWASSTGTIKNDVLKGYSYFFEHISDGLKRIAVTFINRITSTFVEDDVCQERNFQRHFVVASLQFRKIVIKYGETVDYTSGASEITELAYRFALNVPNKGFGDRHSWISNEIPYILDDVIRYAKEENNILDDILDEKRLRYLICIRNELRRRVNNFEEEHNPTRLLEMFFDYKNVDPKWQQELVKIIDYLTSSAVIRHGDAIPGTAQICVSAMADALTRRSGPKWALGGTSSEMENRDIVSHAIAVLAPQVLPLPYDSQKALRSTVVDILKDLPRDREVELRRLLQYGPLTRETLSLLSLKTRAAVLKIHYVTCEPWDPRSMEERKGSRQAKERTPAIFAAWLDRNLPDRHELGLVTSDLGSVDADAYRKVRNWKTENVIQSVEAFGLTEGSRPTPSQGQLHSLVAARDDARWLLRTLDRAHQI